MSTTMEDANEAALVKRLDNLGLGTAKFIRVNDSGADAVSFMTAIEPVDDDKVPPADRLHRFIWYAPGEVVIYIRCHGYANARGILEKTLGRVAMRALRFQPELTVRVK